MKEESKRIKKLEGGFKNLLRELNIDFELPWEEIRPKIENEEEFLAFASDSERQKVYRVKYLYKKRKSNLKIHITRRISNTKWRNRAATTIPVPGNRKRRRAKNTGLPAPANRKLRNAARNTRATHPFPRTARRSTGNKRRRRSTKRRALL